MLFSTVDEGHKGVPQSKEKVGEEEPVPHTELAQLLGARGHVSASFAAGKGVLLGQYLGHFQSHTDDFLQGFQG